MVYANIIIFAKGKRMGYVVACASTLMVMTSGLLLIHNSAKSVSDGGNYQQNVAMMLGGSVLLVCSGCVNKMLE